MFPKVIICTWLLGDWMAVTDSWLAFGCYCSEEKFCLFLFLLLYQDDISSWSTCIYNLCRLFILLKSVNHTDLEELILVLYIKNPALYLLSCSHILHIHTHLLIFCMWENKGRILLSRLIEKYYIKFKSLNLIIRPSFETKEIISQSTFIIRMIDRKFISI